MSKTLVIQSHRTPLPNNWLSECLLSVERWAAHHKFDYRFLGDELFDSLAPEILHKTGVQTVIAADLARLKVLQSFLMQGYQQVVWCDADFLIFSPGQLLLPGEPFSIGREVWVQTKQDRSGLPRPGRYKAYVKVHNAFMVFSKGNSFLDFYADSAERLLQQHASGSMPPQFVGPKLLTALHNVVQCPVTENAGMLSPLVIRDILAGGGKALNLFNEKSVMPLAGANLCASMAASGEISDAQVTELIRLLQSEGI